MQDNPEGELDPAVDVRRRCKKNSPSLSSYIDTKTKESCDRSSEIGTVLCGRGGNNFSIFGSFSYSEKFRSFEIENIVFLETQQKKTWRFGIKIITSSY